MATEANRGQALNTELSRDLGLPQITLMGVGMMIGAGVVIGIGTALQRTGAGGLLLVLSFNGLLAMFSAMSYAELSSAIPRAGGAYNFARVAFGRGWSFLAGWVEWSASAVAGSLYAWALSLYVLSFLAALGGLPWEHHNDHLSVRLLAVTIVSLMALIHCRRASTSSNLGACITLGQIVAVVVIGIAGLACLARHPNRWHHVEPFQTGSPMSVLATMGLVYVVFQGYVVISQAGDEVVEPRKNLPRAILLSALVASLAYLLAALGTLAAVDPAEFGWAASVGERWTAWIDRSGGPDMFFAVAVNRLLPTVGPVLVVIVVVFGAAAALNAVLFSATRALFAMGRDRMLPAVTARVSKRTRTPWVALLVTWAAMAVTAWVAPTMADVASVTSIMFLLLFLLVNVCCIRVRRRMGDELHYGYVMPLFPLFPLLAIVGNAVLAIGLCEMSPLAWVAGPSWVLLGILAYRLYGRYHAVNTRDEIISFLDTSPPAKTGYRILLPVANPDAALDKVIPTMRLAEVTHAEVELLHMVQIPDQVPLADASRYMEVGREAIVEAMLYLQSRFPLHETLRYCRHPARGILSAARDHQADLMILGWSGRSSRTDVLFGTTLDPILEQAPCDVIVLRNCSRKNYRHILVPFAGGPNSLLALRLASILADPAEGLIRPFTVVLPGRTPPDAAEFLQRHAQQLACGLDRFRPESCVSRDIPAALAEAGRDADLVVIGASRTARMARLTRRPMAEQLANRLQCALIMAKAAHPVTSLFNRWL